MSRFKYYMEMVQNTDPEIEELINKLESESVQNHVVKSPMSMKSLLKICQDYLKNKTLYQKFRKKLEDRLEIHSNANFKNFGKWLKEQPEGILKEKDWKEKLIEDFSEALKGDHIQNNHFTYANSGSKFLVTSKSLIKYFTDFLDGISTFEDFKKKLSDSGPAKILEIEASKSIGIDNSMPSKDRDLAEAFYKAKSGEINEIFQKLEMGLKNGVKFKYGGNEFILEKRHGNPNTPFILTYREGKDTNLLNIIYNGSLLDDPEKMQIWTIYPGVASLESPAYLIQNHIDLSKFKKQVPI